MKRIIILLFCVIVITSAFGQAIFGPELLYQFNQPQKMDVYKVNIFFFPIESIFDLSKKLDLEKANFDTRVKEVIKFLKQNLEISKTEFENYLLDRGIKLSSLKNLKYFWITNSVYLETNKESIFKIAECDNVKFIEINSGRYRQIKAEIVSNDVPRSVNGAEPSLKAINAHLLWAMGYTGRNRIFLSMDTGVFPDHPAISENYLGRNYPLSQVWYGVRNPEPVDHASSSHGTHTTGTVLGLDRNNNDTIGVAFNAKWIASDPVASSDDELLSPVDFMEVFQWVLDPDGNPETTDDVPRVINNSWGYDYLLAMQFGACEMPETDILIVIETAGICSPFSAGNDGPGVSTTGFPAMLAFNEVNPMAIGAVNSNNTIASFSSRGPTLCFEGEGSMKIKPEVVAPGVNIRSASGTDSYAYLQGTSMACPHVSGALLLLSEAFPQATAFELKNALYQSAKDLGDEEEDNVYGKGLIDVAAAFEFLSQIYEPQPPVNNDYNLFLSISDDAQIDFICDNQSRYSPVFNIINTGNNQMEDFQFKLFLNEELILDSLFNITINSGENVVFICPELTLNPGRNYLHAIVKPLTTVQEFDVFDNAINKKIIALNHQENFYYNDFQNIEDPVEANLYVVNPDVKNTWTLLNWGSEDQFKSIGVNFKTYLPRAGQKDYLYLPKIILPDFDSISLRFTYAYKKRVNYIYKDSLFVDLSTDCGESFPYTLYINGGETMATVEGNSLSSVFKPVSAEDFDTVTIDLSSFKNQDILIRFVAKNDNGSVIYIDKIELNSINNQNIYQSIISQPKIYPSPAKEILFIEATVSDDIEIFDITGRKINEFSCQIGKTGIDISKYSSGIYFAYFRSLNFTVKFFVE
ncbi:MAG: S8 family serine peptidase [Bacteroidales bacterium]|nr:S8 family serine peptidase [Bacteroidales bacterium]HOL98418.1 S8 family serine peptidase [Bacteroidales bacterium]HOM36683.1 S8 family serine peptidase [Bacteroidales bacterium]HPD24152.1 S8 family serine peptidase [Bacteroidales bacterium]HRT00139.1 S8 family serine peptidase [Bacteroidales bacterium]